MTPIEQLQQADAALNAAGPTPFPLPIAGLEAVVAGALGGLRKSDWWVPGLRERVGAVLRGVSVDKLVDGTAGARPYHVAPPSPAPALRALHAVGLALAEPKRCALVHLGIGSTSDGAFHEALNLAALQQANVIFLVAVHPLGDDAPVGPQLAVQPAALAATYGLGTADVDGHDSAAVSAAVTAARKAGGPHLIQARLSPGQPIH